MTPGLLAFWRFDGDGVDATGNGHDISESDITNLMPGLIGQSVYALASGNYPFEVGPSDEWTISLWFQPGGDYGTANMVLMELTDNDQFDFALLIGASNAGQTLFQFSLDFDEYEVYTGDFADPTEWVHAVAVRDATGATLYVNGVMVGSAIYPRPTPGSPNSRLMSSDLDQTTAIDLAGIWNRALSADDVTHLYNGGGGLDAVDPDYVPPPAPTVDFSADRTSGLAGDITFTPATTGDPHSFSWERQSGGGWSQFSTLSSPTATFVVGTWDIRFSATNAGGTGTITKEAYLTLTPPTTLDYLVAYYRLDGNLLDSSGNNNHLTFPDGPASFSTGLIGQGMDFGYPNNDAPGNSWRNTGRSISFWVNLNGIDPADGLGISVSTGPAMLSVDYNPFVGHKRIVLTSVGPGDATLFANDLSYPNSGWFHVVGVMPAGGNKSIWLDGVKIAENSCSTLYQISSLTVSNAAQGVEKIDEVAIYDFALTPTQVATLYNSGNGYRPL